MSLTDLRGAGFHCTLRTTLPATPAQSCSLNLFYDLPSEIILDIYQLTELALESRLTQPRFPASIQHCTALDLEKPAHQVSERAQLWLAFAIPESELAVNVPIHLRTLSPSTTTVEGYKEVGLMGPKVFLSCSTDQNGEFCCFVNAHIFADVQATAASFTSCEHGFDTLLGTNQSSTQRYYAYPPSQSCLTQQSLSMSLPVGSTAHYDLVAQSNTYSTWLGALCLLWASWRSTRPARVRAKSQ